MLKIISTYFNVDNYNVVLIVMKKCEYHSPYDRNLQNKIPGVIV